MIYPTSLNELLNNRRECILLECISGSHAYGLSRPGSDVDRRGVFVTSMRAYVQLEEPPKQVSDEKGDVVFYSLVRFAELAAASNPNMLELLYTPEDCVKFRSPLIEPMIERREIFLSRACFQSHVAYANAQIHKAKGQNKWINRPQPKDPPKPEEFCWFIPKESVDSNTPMRPISFEESGVQLIHCHAAALEHSSEIFRLYNYGVDARGVFRGGNLVPESIPIDDESDRFVGLMIYHRNAYEAATRDHRHYWEWKSKRNEARWQAQERGDLDYDAKNLMHTFRLLMSAESLIRQGELRVRFDGEERDFLMAVRDGKFAYEELIEKAEQKTNELGNLLDDSCLPTKPDRKAINELMIDIVQKWEKEHG